ncbi:MAG: hypothetical protein HYS12_06080 [Planctomycetes bacterium]|nr:hypothetical protein [Planctomycetota bacterium]
MPRSRKRRRPGNPWRLPIALLVAVLVVGGAAVGIAVLVGRDASSGKNETDDSQKYVKHNFRFKAPAAPWESDDELRKTMEVALAYRRKGPVNCMALDIQDYGVRFPGKGVLIDEALGHLRKYFPELAWAPKAPATTDKLEKCELLASQPALGIEFEGSHNEVDYAGECLIVEYRGWVYWFYTFAPQNTPQARNEWPDLRAGFGLLDERAGWQEKEPDRQRVQGNGYALAYAKGIWQQRQNPELWDARADLVLEGRDPKDNREGEASKAGKVALVQVVLLPREKNLTSAAAAVRDHLLARYAKDYGIDKKDVQLTVDLDKKGAKKEGNTRVGKATGHVSKNRLQPAGGTADRFVLLATVPQGDQVVAIYADCDWKRHDFWEQEFNALLEKFESLQ